MKQKLLVILFIVVSHLGYSQDDRPNILWITIEDWSPDLSCYGTPGIHTPHVDQLASEGVLFNNAFTTSPVCSTSRSAMMTGFHQNYIGANQHRLLPNQKKELPHGIKPIPHILKEAGYYTCLMSWKTDCNFKPFSKTDLFTDTDDWIMDKKLGWRNRKEGQPFFARITFKGTHRSWIRDPRRPISIDDVKLPPYYPNTDFCKRDWANGLEQMQLVDRQVGELLEQLKEDGLADNTIVFFIGDHGRCHIRGKQFLYDGGIQIPMIMRWPGHVKAGTKNNNLVQSIDICQTILDAAKAKSPVPLHGQNLFSKEVKKRKYIFAARDKMDQTHDAMRAIRSKDYKLIVNLMPERAYLQYNQYKEGGYPMLAEMHVLNAEGKLTPEQAAFLAPTKPEIELFDLQKDPFEVKNVADDPAYAKVKKKLLAKLNNWRENVIEDKGVSEDFRALNIYPKECPAATVDEWAFDNADKYDYHKYGWPSWYPTRPIEEWKRIRQLWEPYVFIKPGIEPISPNYKFKKGKGGKAKKASKFDYEKQYF